MGLYLRGNTYWYRYSVNGERRFRSTEETDEKLAQAKAEQWQEEALAEKELFQKQYSLSNMIELYLASLRRRQRRRVDGRDSRYVTSANEGLSRWAREINVDSLSEVTAERLQRWIDHKELIDKVRPVTMEEYIGQIRRLFSFACAKHPSLRNPMKNVHWQKPGKNGDPRTVYLSRDDSDRLINECGDVELKYILFCGIRAGMRFEEVDKSSPRWFDLHARLINIQIDPNTGWQPKDLEARSIPIDDDFLAFLQTQYAHRMNGRYMVAPDKLEQGAWRYRFDFGNRFKAYMRKKGFGHICFHDLRRSFAIQHIQSPENSVTDVAYWLGDDPATTVRHYGKYMPKFHSGINSRGPMISPVKPEQKIVPMAAAV